MYLPICILYTSIPRSVNLLLDKHNCIDNIISIMIIPYIKIIICYKTFNILFIRILFQTLYYCSLIFWNNYYTSIISKIT